MPLILFRDVVTEQRRSVLSAGRQGPSPEGWGKSNKALPTGASTDAVASATARSRSPCGERARALSRSSRARRGASSRPPRLRPAPYFVRGQKKPRRPSPFVRGTTCTWRWATLWLTTLLLATNVPCAPSASGSDGGDALHPLEERADVDELGQRHDVVDRHDEHVAGEQRRAVEEGDRDVVAEHDLGRRVAGDDGAERAARVERHAAHGTARCPGEFSASSTARRARPAIQLVAVGHLTSRALPHPSHQPDPLPGHEGVALTDLLPAAATTDGGEPQTDGAVRTRVVLDTSVLIADPSCVIVVRRRRRRHPAHRHRGARRPEERGPTTSAVRRAPRCARSRSSASAPAARWPTPVPVGDDAGDAADRDQRRAEAPARRARPRPGAARQPHHRRRPRPGRARARRRWCPTTPRCASRPPTSASPPPSTSRPGARSPRRPAGGRRSRPPTRSSTACTPPARSPSTRSTAAAGVGENEFAVLRAGSQSALARRVGDDLRAARATTRPRRGGCGPVRRSSASPSSCCSTRRRASSPSTGGPAPARRCWPSPPGSSRSSSSGRYERLAIYRPLVPVGRADVGFLPGGLDEKLDPWMSAIHDAIVALTDQQSAATTPAT